MIGVGVGVGVVGVIVRVGIGVIRVRLDGGYHRFVPIGGFVLPLRMLTRVGDGEEKDWLRLNPSGTFPMTYRFPTGKA